MNDHISLLFHETRTELVGIIFNHGGLDNVESPDETVSDREDRLDELFQTVSNRRRRYVLTHLLANDGETTVRDLVGSMAAWENQVKLAAVTYKQRKRAYTSLVQIHLPQLYDGGYIAYDADRKEMTLTTDGDSLAELLAGEWILGEPGQVGSKADTGKHSWLPGISWRRQPYDG